MPDRCTASGAVRSCLQDHTTDHWGGNRDGEIICCDCGVVVRVWVRATDLWPRAKIRSHQPPPGVTPAPFAFNPRGYVAAPESTDD